MHNETKKEESAGERHQTDLKRVMVLRTTSVFFPVNAVFVLQNRIRNDR